jgi:hypothetical protein
MYTGPNLVEDNLVFGYDTNYGIADNGKSTRFYKGEPTTNLLPAPERNGRFTTANSWGSYNTNQYNGNSDFNIGTIGSVSNNIVTLSSVGHNIRTFDVLNPATTGGGVNAGQHYWIKKISANSFSLHTYNSSQNGSLGYINPVTGTHKVLDDVMLDNRVSISASSFPNMWHGAPHLPNSGMIKEIVPNGGYVKGTNSLRMHAFRGDNVVDGMAYNVYTPVSQGDVITVSYFVKPVDARAYGKTWSYSTYFGGAAGSSYGGTLNSTGDWQQVSIQWTASATFSFYQYFFPTASSDIYAIDFADLQVEVNKGHATPFTLSSRSDTASLIDLKKTTSIDVGNVEFDSTGQPEFDGSDAYINVPYSSVLDTPVGATYEMVIYPTGQGEMLSRGTSDTGTTPDNPRIYWGTNGSIYFDWSIQGQDTYVVTSAADCPANQYSYIACTALPGQQLRVYVNGVEATYTTNVQTLPTTIPNTNHPIVIGGASWIPRYFTGKIPVVKLHKRALTLSEIKQNFKAYKYRFNI